METLVNLVAIKPFQMLLLLTLLEIHMSISTAATTGPTNFCHNTTVLTTTTKCHTCSITMLINCPKGYTKTPGKLNTDCRYPVKTGALSTLYIRGCSQECHKEVTVTSCCPGYWGPDCIDCPEEAKKPCYNNGVCSDGMGGNGTCTCKPGFSGTACEDCAENLYGSTCSSACRCVHGLCNAGIQGDGKCTCFSGYKGPNCDQLLPECKALNCPANSRCIEEAHTGTLVCKCMPGHQESGDKCTSVNPCLQQRAPCHQHATCAHVGPGKHSCSCVQGYSGDGVVCVPIDPCQTDLGGCSGDSARCVYDGPGKSHCVCQDGFHNLQGGVSCSIKDVCRPDSCSRHAYCATSEPGVASCKCKEGFLGNGKICFGNIMQRLTELNTEPGGPWAGELGSAITLFGTLSWPLSNLGPFTVFVPVNKGFKTGQAKSLASDQDKTKYLCKLHIVAGEMNSDKLRQGDSYYTLTGKGGEAIASDEDKQLKIRLYGSRKKADLVQTDIVASNGVIHLINKLMDSVSPTVKSEKEEDLMKVLSDNGKFVQFKGLLQKANMAVLLEEPGPFTVFAPTGGAFDALRDGALEYLTSSEGSFKLLELLRNHVVPSTVEVYNAVSSPQIVTKANQILTFNVTENGQILVNDKAVILEADVQAKNGRLYSLDRILVPSSIEPLLPHRCDVTESHVVKGPCVSCLRMARLLCNSNESLVSFRRGCLITSNAPLAFGGITVGCSPLCNETVTIPRCCKGFHGPDCSPCPGGFSSPCSGHGQCMDGIEGNGTCLCGANFKGSRCQFCSSPNKHGPSCDKKCDCINGECENRPEADGRCKVGSCQNGYTGKYCERHTQACGPLVHFCHAHAECDFNGGAVKCVCKPGYQGDGVTCVEADPCALPRRGGCSENAKCIKMGPDSHTCQCLAGWRADGDECQAINACLDPDRGGCHPNATCIYVGPGQSDCMCKNGFLGNGKDCQAVNQCVTENGACHFLASCRYLSGAWTCVCDDGWMGDGLVCYGNLEQELVSIPDISSFFRMVSDGEISRMLIHQNITVLVPSKAAVNQMTTEERDYWTARSNMPSLVRNHMINGIYSLSALRNTSRVLNLLKVPLPVSNTNESVVIFGATVTKANVKASNGLIHIIDKVLIPGKEQSQGLLAVLNQRPEFSLFRSYLIKHNLTDRIEQDPEYTVFAPTDVAIEEYLKETAQGFMELNLTQYHVVLNQRLLRSDLLGGAYKETMLGFSYQLEIFPKDEKLYVNGALMNASDIETIKGVIHGLTSVLKIRLNRCDKKTFKTALGSCQDCFHPLKTICGEGATAVVSVRRKCMFSRIYHGERLLSIGCRPSCMTTTIERRCCGGYFGEHCELCPGREGQPCFGNGACVDGTNGTGVCLCNKGFTGTGCESCQSGKYSIHCDQDCACRNGRCSDGVHGDGSCECDVGWRGVTCDEKITSKADELCNTVKCHTSANCVTNPDGTKCVCAAGFEGNGTYCKAKDACKENNGGCSPTAKCKRTLPGRRDCVCNPGYSGDGLVCVGINPCLEGNGGCHSNAECIHTGPNRTSCACSQGYSGNGKTCTMIDLCKKVNDRCHMYASCNMTGPGVRTCTCLPGYIGDGLNCKGTVWRELQGRSLREFYIGMIMTDISLRGRGPFTVFIPSSKAFKNISKLLKPSSDVSSMNPTSREKLANILRYHIVSCHMLLASDLTTPRNLTTLMGDVLSVTSSEGSILINNKANVTFSDEPSTNGVLHVIDTVLVPDGISLPLTDESAGPTADKSKLTTAPTLSEVTNSNGYKTFYKLLEDTDVLSSVKDLINQPLIMLLPSDAVMAALPQDQKDFLYNQHNRPHLLEYLKYHILHRTKVFASELVHHTPARTLQGSELTFTCGGFDRIGEIFVNGDSCRITQRHLHFNGGMAYGIDCLLAPPSLGGRCDNKDTVDITLPCGWCGVSKTRCPDGSVEKDLQHCDLPMDFVKRNTGCSPTCTMSLWSPKCCAGYFGRDCLACPGGAKSPCENHGKCDDGHLGDGNCTCDPGFQGVACELCLGGRYGPSCRACNCSAHGSCDEGLKGTGACFCEEGWTGRRCETQLGEGPVCSPPCSPNGVCMSNDTCVCKLLYEGDGINCTLADLCSTGNGGCARASKCSQKGETVKCTCPKGYSGDGYACQPVDPCLSGENGGCHEHATCTMTGAGKKKCACKDKYVGDGLTCEPKELPLDRCAEENGQCHLEAQCTDLHFEDSSVGVFHYRSLKGQYKLNYTQAQEACTGRGASIATYTQLSYAQQAGFNLCAAGWLDQARVSYPTTYANPNCGFGHVGIVDYGKRSNLSETWDTFCYRIKEVKCECKTGYVGDGYVCVGNLFQVLGTRPMFSNFLSQILNYSLISEPGRQFVMRLSNLTIQSTLFVPANDGLSANQTLTHRDIEYHLSEGRALALKDLTNGSHIHTRLGHSLTVMGIADFLNPGTLSSRYINDQFLTDSDIPASNGIIHVLQGPLIAPPPKSVLPAAHKAGLGVGVVLLIVVVCGVAFVGYHFFTHTTKPFQFHYFKDNEEEDSTPPDCNPSICNPMYVPAPSDPAPSTLPEEDKHQVADSGPYDLLQDS